MTDHAVDRLVFGPDDVDLARSPLAGRIEADTYVLGAFNPGLTRLPGGNLLMMVRIAEALTEPVVDGHARSIRWEHGHYAIDAWPEAQVRFEDPRVFRIADDLWRVLALTSISWLLPVELAADGLEVVAVHYDRAIPPAAPYQCYGVEDARIAHVGGRWLMTTCSVSPERLSTTLYSSEDAVAWALEGIVLDHQNKDMLVFEGLIDGKYWAQTRPLGDVWFAYPPGAEYRPGPSINLASSPDALHWKPHEMPGLRPHAFTASTARMGGGAPPRPTPARWGPRGDGVAPKGEVGVYRTYWSLLDRDEPWRPVRSDHAALIEPNPALTAGMADRMYLHDVVFTTGIADGGDVFIVASGEADLACRITHVPKAAFGL